MSSVEWAGRSKPNGSEYQPGDHVDWSAWQTTENNQSWMETRCGSDDPSTEHQSPVVPGDLSGSATNPRCPHCEPGNSIFHTPRTSPVEPSRANGGSTISHLVQENTLGIFSSEIRRLKRMPHENGTIRTFETRFQSLSPRELDVLFLMVQGRSCKEIAARLDVGLATAAKHRARILQKLCVHNTVELLYLICAALTEQPPVNNSEHPDRNAQRSPP